MPDKHDEAFNAIFKALTREEAASGRPDNKAHQEQGALSSGDYEERLKKSKTKNELLLHLIFRWGALCLFILVCFAATSFVVSIGYLFWKYVLIIAQDEAKLVHFLLNIWKVMSGAILVVLLQMVGWLVKNQQKTRH